MTYKPRARVYGGRWATVRRRVLDRDNHTCQIGLLGCTNTATCVDHITPVSWGGEWYDPTNLRAACHNCNAALAVLARKHAPKHAPKSTYNGPRGHAPARPQAEPSRTW